MKNLRWWIAGSLLAVAGAAAQAGVSSTVAFTTDYDFRGISQTAKHPALSASIDYAHDSGFSIGAWASNLDFGDSADEKLELDIYGGFTKSYESGWGFTVGGILYAYPGAHYNVADLVAGDPPDYSGDNLNYVEANIGANYKSFAVKYWYSPNYGNAENGFADGSAKASYLEANYSVPLPKDYSLGLHAGFSFGDYWDNLGVTPGGSAKYEDYSVALNKTIGDFSFSAKFIYPKVGQDYLTKDGPFANGKRALLSVSTTF
jgi:uncharacterized protein (TIGR02001 family)